jgi:hypothetical protein
VPFFETKVYFDGSHYIAIPHTVRPARRRRKTESEEEPENNDDGIDEVKEEAPQICGESKEHSKEKERAGVLPNGGTPVSVEPDPEAIRKERIRKMKNMVARRIRCTRKANLRDFNYFVTLTYDDKLHSEVSFKKKLRTCLTHLCLRKDWKYIGVWERSPEKNRLHFHGVFAIPEGAMPGLLFEKSDYSLKTHRMQTTVQNTYFNDNFGRSDFEPIDDRNGLYNALAYLLKYIEKTGERIVYSKGLPQFFISDIMDDDVICRIGQDDKKLLLFDDFTCIDEGELIGRVSKDAIKGMRGIN